MTFQGFQEFLRVTPFEPFVVHVADGRIFYVRHPDVISFSPRQRTVSVLNDDRRIEVIEMLLIASLRPFNRAEARRNK